MLHTGDIFRTRRRRLPVFRRANGRHHQDARRKGGAARGRERDLQLEGVVDCAVVGVADEALGEAVKAYVTLRPGCRTERRAISSSTAWLDWKTTWRRSSSNRRRVAAHRVRQDPSRKPALTRIRRTRDERIAIENSMHDVRAEIRRFIEDNFIMGAERRDARTTATRSSSTTCSTPPGSSS